MSPYPKEPASDRAPPAATPEPQIVMAEQITHDVVKEAQSMGGPSPIDDTASTTNNSAGNGEVPSGPKPDDSKAVNDPATISATDSDAASAAAQTSKTTNGATNNASVATTDNQARSDTPLADSKELQVNGDAGETSATESQIAVGEASGGSDTDISRPGSVDLTKQLGGHLRSSSSLKKPVAFKSVSVTKSFLAKSAVSTPAARPGDKAPTSTTAAPSALQTARPRLVAKSGGSNTPRASGKLNGAGSGPDASKVWNKNQPVPPAPPKQYTDEELKQQYGIHLATRLQADEGGKEAKWADIDDDEDDWTPETVQWMDGSKSTVAAENQAPPVEEPKPILKKEPPVVVARPTPALAVAPAPAPASASAPIPAPTVTSTLTPSPAPAPISSAPKSGVTSGTKTILKPGANAQANALKPKGQPDKPTLVSKPSSGAPVKSPWAPLPPVDKVSPIQINPPAQQPPSRYSRDTYGYDDMPPPHAPAKEIAPDDFNRAWRDDRGNRELFNSHSGRYEPVGDMRRGSMRDNSYRQQPSVLQRPTQDGPAEPSAAFQTSRTSADGPVWGRRRNSSNVSGGSGRRMSFDRRGPDLPPVPANVQLRESQPVNGIDATRQSLPAKPPSADQPVVDSAPVASPNIAHAQPVSPFGSAASQDTGAIGAPGAPTQIQNLVEVQERLLHANIDAVKLRKQKEKEQEAKEEAERKERLRKRLEAMGFKEDEKPKGKEHSPSRVPQKSPQKEKAVPAPMQSPPKPPVPTSKGEVAQYGVMKVHQPQPVQKSLSAESGSKSAAPKPSPSPVKAHNQAQKQAPSEAQPKLLPSLGQSVPPANNSSRDSDNRKASSDKLQTQAQQSRPVGPADAKVGQTPQGPWSTTLPSQRPAGWGSSGSSVWGPPQTRDRALGNGTFGQQVPAPPQSNAKPIGSSPPVNNLPSQPPVAPTQQQQQQQQQQPHSRPNMYPQTVPALAQAAAAPKPGPIAPPAADRGWSNFHAHIRQDDRDMRAKASADRERLGTDYRPELRETYTDQKGNKETTLHQRVGGPEATGAQSSAAPDNKVNDASAPGAPHQPATHGGRSSRFFPKSQPTTKQESPPPPETESHPAFSGDMSNPVVRMPKPSPRVRLPPAAVGPATQLDAPVSMPSRSRLGLGARPLALTQEWQARFNSLLEKPAAAGTAPTPIARPLSSVQTSLPSKPGSLAIAASSKAPLEVRQMSASATVSLPLSASRKSFVSDSSSEVTSCSGAEDLLEDREFGSLPTVKVPSASHLAANEPPVGFPPNTRQHSKFGPKFYPTSKPPLLEDRLERNEHTIDVVIRIGKIRSPLTKKMPIRRKGNRGSSQQKSRRNPTTGTDNASSSGQNSRSRKPSSQQNQGTNAANAASSTRGPPGNPWSANRSAPAHSNPWNNKRQTPAAPVH